MNKSIYIKNFIVWCFALISMGSLTRCAEEFESPEPVTGNTLAEIAAGDTTLQIFTAAIAKTGIGISLGNINSGQHTVFAPTDSAFRAYFQPIIGGGPGDEAIVNYVNNLSASTNPTLAAFTGRLQYHVISSDIPSSELNNSKTFTTINGARISFSKNGNTVFVNGNTGSTGGKLRAVDIDGANGVIHKTNKFLTAISLASIFAPRTTSGAPGGLGLTIDYTKAPPVVTIGTLTTGNSPTAPDANHDILAAAVRKTGLAPILRPNVSVAFLPDFTMFAPDDAAMITYLGTLSAGVVTDETTAITFVNNLADTDPKLATLTNVLKYHVVSGRVVSTDLAANQEVTTLEGSTIKIVTLSPSMTIKDQQDNTVTITALNVVTNAGVIHRVNAVLKP